MREWMRFFAILFVCVVSFLAGGFVATLNQEVDTLRTIAVVRIDEDTSRVLIISGPNAYRVTIPKYGDTEICAVFKGKIPLCERP